MAESRGYPTRTRVSFCSFLLPDVERRFADHFYSDFATFLQCPNTGFSNGGRGISIPAIRRYGRKFPRTHEMQESPVLTPVGLGISDAPIGSVVGGMLQSGIKPGKGGCVVRDR